MGDIKALVRSRDWSRLHGVSIERDKTTFHWFNPQRRELQELIDASLPGTFNSVVSTSDDEEVLLIFASSDTNPGTYYTMDRRTSRLRTLGRARLSIDPGLMAPTEPFSFTARDGLEIHGYITRPKSHGERPGPLVVYPHDGPFDTRDSWGYDPVVQFLASRGYGVIQVNFRGSSGYGTAFEQAGWQQLGGRIQDDLADAVQWAIATGAADSNRIAIFGGAGHGGYAALMGLARFPDLYACAINYQGQLDLSDEWNARERLGYYSKDYFKTRIGDKVHFLRAQSPTGQVAKFGAPSLHIYVYPDSTAYDEPWLRLRRRMVDNKKPFEEMIVKDDKIVENLNDIRMAVFSRIEAFLAKHIPPDN